MKKFLIGLAVLAVGVASAEVTQMAATVENGWKSYTDRAERCQIAVPQEWGKRAGQIFIQDASRNVMIMLYHREVPLEEVKRQIRESLSGYALKAVSQSADQFIYRFTAPDGRVGFYKARSNGKRTCVAYKSMSPDMATALEDVVLEVGRTLRIR